MFLLEFRKFIGLSNPEILNFFSLALIIHIYFHCNTTDTQVTDKAHGPHQFTQKRSPNH